MQEQIKSCTKQIGLEIIKLIDCLPNKPSAWEISRQIVRSSTSIGANYRAACRAKSALDFIHKLKIVEEEVDETHYWLELLKEGHFLEGRKLDHIRKEVNEIISIVVASIKTYVIKLIESDNFDLIINHRSSNHRHALVSRKF